LMQQRGSLLLLLLPLFLPFPCAFSPFALSQPSSNAPHRFVRYRIVFCCTVAARSTFDVRFEVDSRRIDEEDGRVELAPNDEGVLPELSKESFSAPARWERAALLAVRMGAANGEGRSATVLVEEGRLRFVVTEVKGRKSDAAEEVDCHCSNPRRKGRRLDLE
jgi:hypothetical protein